MSINGCNNVTFLKSSFLCRTVFNNLCNVNAIIGSEIYFLLLCLLVVEICANILSLYADYSTLNATILFNIIDHLIHNCSRNSETITYVRTSFTEEHSIDADKFALYIHQRSTRITTVDGSISLDE